MAKVHEGLTAALAVAHLYRRYQTPEWFGVHELKLWCDESHRERRADFVALRLWGGGVGPALGFEVKVSRSDFLHEMAQHSKRAPLENLCHACYFVAPRGVLRMDELPVGWGWLELQAGGLRMMKEAQHHRRHLTGGMMHGLMKRLIDDRWHQRARRPAVVDIPKPLWKLVGLEVTPAQLVEAAREMFQDELRQARQKGEADATKLAGERAGARSETLKAIQSAIFKATGIDTWTSGNPELLEEQLRLGWSAGSRKALLALQNFSHQLENMQDQTSRILDSVSKSEQREAS